MEKDFVSISRNEYARLLTNSFKLEALERGGVDNWIWYGDSLRDGKRRLYEENLKDAKSVIKKCYFSSSYDEKNDDEEDFFLECVEYEDIGEYFANLD